MASFGVRLYTYTAHRGAPSRNEISIPPNACGNLKTNKARREAPRRNVLKSKQTEAEGAADGFTLKTFISIRMTLGIIHNDYFDHVRHV